MSIDFSVYTEDDRPLSCEELSKAMQEAGWVLRIVRNCFDPARFAVITEGDVKSGDYLFGWAPRSERASDFEGALRDKNFDVLHKWATDTEDLSAGFVHFSPYPGDDEISQGDLEDIAATTSAEYAEAIKRARLEYTIDPHALSLEFLEDLARVICRLRDGAWTDNFEISEVLGKTPMPS